MTFSAVNLFGKYLDVDNNNRYFPNEVHYKYFYKLQYDIVDCRTAVILFNTKLATHYIIYSIIYFYNNRNTHVMSIKNSKTPKYFKIHIVILFFKEAVR